MSSHVEGSDLEERLTAVVHPERGTVAKMVTALEQKEIEAQGLQAVLNNLLREVGYLTKTWNNKMGLEKMGSNMEMHVIQGTLCH